jgi:AAA domain
MSNMLAKKNAGKSLDPQKIMLFGGPKVGKTTLIGQLASKFKLIYFDLENGSGSLWKLPDECLENITLVKVQSSYENPRAFATIDKIVKGGNFNICETHGTVDCVVCKKNPDAVFINVSIPTEVNEETLKTVVVIDSGTELSNMINFGVLKLAGIKINPDSEPYKEQFDEYGHYRKFLDNIFENIQHGKFNCIVTAHVCEILSNDRKRVVKIVPSIGTRPYASNVGKFFGHVIFGDVVNGKHKFQSSTGFSNIITTGSHFDIDISEDATLEPFFTGQYGFGNKRKEAAKEVLIKVSANNTNIGTVVPNKPTIPGKTTLPK